MIGTQLCRELVQQGFDIIVLTRKARPSANGIRYKEWDPQKGSIDETAIAEADHIIHLAGANVGEKRWTKKRKQEIVDSRIKSGELLVKAIQSIPNKIKTIVSASAIGWYGPDAAADHKAFVETDPADNSFLGATCQKWENAIRPVESLGKRLVIFRTGIVLSNQGGAYPELKKSFRFRVAAIVGSGRQVISWIHIDDLVQLYIRAIKMETIAGIYNAVSPGPVTNSAFMQTIGAVKEKKYICIHIPSFALKIALGEMSIEVLKSATVSADKILATGYHFLYPAIEEAIAQLEENR